MRKKNKTQKLEGGKTMKEITEIKEKIKRDFNLKDVSFVDEYTLEHSAGIFPVRLDNPNQVYNFIKVFFETVKEIGIEYSINEICNINEIKDSITICLESNTVAINGYFAYILFQRVNKEKTILDFIKEKIRR